MSNASQQSQSKFEYHLPQDTPRVELEATICAAFAFFHDCIASIRLSRLDIELRAIRNCSELQEKTKNNLHTNDIELFNRLTVQNYTKAYLEKQAYYDRHQEELIEKIQEIIDIGSDRFLHDLADSIEASFKKREVL